MLTRCNGYLVNTVDTDDLVLEHQGISSHSPEYAPGRFQATLVLVGRFELTSLGHQKKNRTSMIRESQDITGLTF